MPRPDVLSNKSQDGSISPDELEPLEELVTADHVLTLPQAKAGL
jgi:hypothetical protein